jgi:hypothetical protein
MTEEQHKRATWLRCLAADIESGDATITTYEMDSSPYDPPHTGDPSDVPSGTCTLNVVYTK